MARHIFSAILSYRKGKPICIHIFVAMLHVLVWNSTHVSSFLLLNRNKRNIVLVSHPLILQIVCMVHDQVSLPNVKTALTCGPPVFDTSPSTERLFFCMSECPLFAGLHSFFNGIVFPCRFMAQPKILNLSSKVNLKHPDVVPPQTRWFGFQIPSVCFFNQLS